MKHLLMILTPFFIIGIIVHSFRNYFIIGAVIAALFLMLIKKIDKYFILFSILFILLGFMASSLYIRNFEVTYKKLINTKIYCGYVLEINNGNYLIQNYKESYKIKASLYEKTDAVPGDYILFSGKINPVQNYKKKALLSSGIDGYVNVLNGSIRIIKKRNVFMLPYRIKYNINKTLTSIDKDGGAFISGLISGYISDMSTEVSDDFTNLGISHILAISGFNIAVIYYFLMFTLKNISARKRYVITLIICFIYTFFGGFVPSITRAFIMISISLIGKLINRNYDILNGITLTALIMLVINPYYIFNLGFLLSFSATYGIILLKDDIKDKIPKKLEKINDELSVSMGAFITTLPIILWSRGFFSLISLVINVLIGPIVAFTTIFAFTSTIIYLITGFKSVYYPCVFIGVTFVKLAEAVSKINVMIFPGRPTFIFFVFYFIFMALFFNYINIKISIQKKRILNAVIAGLTIFCIIFHYPYLKIHVLNVGQGDCIFIETPERHTILIDTGPKVKDYIAAQDRIVPYINRQGYSKIDLLIITHLHNDHAGGLEYIRKNLKVDKIAAFQQIENVNSNLYIVSKNDCINIEKVYLKILAPEGTVKDIDDENETCLIIELRYKYFSALFTADATKEDMDKISGNYNILKVPHHGSINSLSEEMLDNSLIETAIISVGKNNFGHPSSKVIKEFENRNIKVFRTDEQGNITVLTTGKRYKVLSQQ